MTNWKKLIEEIRERSGMTQKQIAEKCNSRPSTISNLVQGAAQDTAHTLGVELIAIHKKVMRTWERKNKRNKP